MKGGESGAIAAVALAVLGVLSVLTGAWIRLVADQRESVRIEGDYFIANSLAQTGIERILAWFADPASFNEPYTVDPTTACRSAGAPGTVFSKRCRDADGLPSYRASDGAPQFGGTAERPAVLVGWDEVGSLLDRPPMAPLDSPARSSAVRLEVRLFAPTTPDSAATVLSRAEVGRATAIVRAELMEGPWRGLTQAVFAGVVGSNAVPIRTHWGGVAIAGGWDASEVLDGIPRRSDEAAVDGHDYVVQPGSDRWAMITASGPIIGPLSSGGSFVAPFAHLSQYAAVPRVGLWGYEALKGFARRHGRYFTTRGTGLVYRDDAGPGLSPTMVFGSFHQGRRLLFIDTLDRKPPREDNLETLHVSMDFVSGDAYVGGHLTIVPGPGGSVVVDSPSGPATPDGPPLAREITINGVHYRGALVVAGHLAAEARTRIVGSLVALQGVRDTNTFEVWYDAGLRSGYRQGFPPVVIKPGTRYIYIMIRPSNGPSARSNISVPFLAGT